MSRRGREVRSAQWTVTEGPLKGATFYPNTAVYPLLPKEQAADRREALELTVKRCIFGLTGFDKQGMGEVEAVLEGCLLLASRTKDLTDAQVETAQQFILDGMRVDNAVYAAVLVDQ